MTTYFISGASSGLGAEMARRLVRRGDAVAISARRHDLLEALAAELSAKGGLVTVHPADVRDLDQVRRAILEADERHGGLDVVVANAGRGGGGRIGTGRWRENREVIETNLLGTLNQAEVAMELFRRREGGHLVLVSSLASVRGLPGSAAVYSASKAAVTTLGESLRIQTKGSGVRVTTLLPGYVKTELSSRARFPYLSPLGRGVEAMIEAIDTGRGEVVVPALPWRPLGWMLRAVPEALIRRFM